MVRRGFDPDEVRTYLQAVSRSIEVLEEREQELRAAIGEANERAAHPVVDEATLTASLGQHSAQILRHAHEEAARIVVQAQEGASTLLREAQNQANELQAQSEATSAERVAEAELMVATAEQDARADVERAREQALLDGEQIIARAKDEGRALLEQVQEARRRVLADLTTRRRTLTNQIEQLRAARDELAASVLGVRDSVDSIIASLSRSDDSARAAATAAADRLRLNPPAELDEEELIVPPDGGADPVEAGVHDQDAAGIDAVTPSVDELFARIRAGVDDTGQTTVVPPVPSEASAPQVPEVGVEEAQTEMTGLLDSVEVPVAEPEESPDQALVTRRDDLLGPVLSQLGRHIKRALGDDQNRLLDVLRSSPALSGDALLGPEDLHLSTFTLAAQGHMADAYAAGVVYGGGPAGTLGPDGTADQAAAGLARTVVTMIRRRITDGSEGADDMGDRVGAAFREWRGERIERLVGDYATQAFSAGVASATPAGGHLHWVLTNDSGCSDCDDNALAGPVTAVEGFPTGHPYPPAHSGCRCLVAPATV
jgi:cell division septum initiation protein DivIVA